MAKQKMDVAAAREDAQACLKLDTAECMEVLSNWNLSMLNFYIDRAQAYLDLPGEAPALLTPNDCIDAQERFLTRMVADYTSQAERLKQLLPGGLTSPAESDGADYEARLLKAQADATAIIEQAKQQAERILANAEKRAEELTGAEDHQAGHAAKGGESTLKKSA